MDKNYKSIRIFKSDFWERMTHVHPIMPLLCWVPIISFLLFHSANSQNLSSNQWVMLAGLGVLTWSITEYVLHRYLFHMETPSPWKARFQFLIHGLHHDDPQDPTRLVFPPVPAFILGGILFVFFRFLVGPVYIEPFFAFFLIGYLTYDYIHYGVHHFKPRTSLGRWLKQHHMRHHYVSHEAWYGISSPLWDWLFSTLSAPEAVTVAASAQGQDSTSAGLSKPYPETYSKTYSDKGHPAP